MSNIVLLIEDNEQNQYLVIYLLSGGGFHVHCASDGPSGIALAREIVPDLILLDIQLPGMDGYEVARRLRQVEQLHGVPIIALTSYAMVGDREKALQAGCNGYMEKPINPETFVTEVQQHLSENPRKET